MKRFSFFHVKYISLAEQAAAPNQGAAAFFYSTETEHFCRGDGQRAAAKTVEEYLLSPNKKNSFQKFGRTPPGTCNKNRGGKQPSPGKGGDSMSMEQNKRHAFDAFCKRLVKNEAVNIHLEYARQGKREVAFSELTQRELQSLCCTDHYAPERRVFTVLDMDFEIEDAGLVRALAALTLERRSIVLLAYLLEMKDDEIAQKLQMNRSTVQYQRASTCLVFTSPSPRD